MGSLPVLRPGEVERLLLCLGFTLARQRGSHRQYRNSEGRGTTVSFHRGDLSPILLRQIARDIQTTVDQLLQACD